MATKQQRAEIKSLIRFYDKRGKDWSDAAEFLLWKYNGGSYECLHTRMRKTKCKQQ